MQAGDQSAYRAAENAYHPYQRRERAMLWFRRMRSLQKVAAVHASVNNLFNSERSLSSRDTNASAIKPLEGLHKCNPISEDEFEFV